MNTKLTYLGTFEAELRALKRLHIKQLISGPVVEASGLVCAIGALKAHCGAMDEGRDIVPQRDMCELVSRRWHSDGEASAKRDIIVCNETFRRNNNSVISRKLRYKHVLQYVIAVITNLTGKRPAIADA